MHVKYKNVDETWSTPNNNTKSDNVISIKSPYAHHVLFSNILTKKEMPRKTRHIPEESDLYITLQESTNIL
jgi:hypothetical protein